MTRKIVHIEPRFSRKVDKGPDCWDWTGAVTHDGYGRFKVGDSEVPASRYLYEATHGRLDPEIVLYHECGNPACVRPKHMKPLTPKELTAISGGPTATNARKIKCVHGHPLSGSNLYIDPESKRKCRTCMRRIQEERKASKGPRRPKPSKTKLAQELKTKTAVEIGREYGFSDTAVRNWARKYGISS